MDPAYPSVLGMFALGVVTWVAAARISAPYGRHERSGWGPTIPSRVGWLVMESPAVFAFLGFFFTGAKPMQPGALALALLWLLHYVQRVFVYPFRMRSAGKRMPAAIAAMAFGFNIFNAYLNGRWLSDHPYEARWLLDPRFVAGAGVFALGLLGNQWADAVLFRLRGPGDAGYRIPHGGLYEVISCPNYFAELVEWLGFALAAWSPAALAFAFYTAANLVPRARKHHAWYRQTFAEYPAERKAIIPFVW